MVKELRSLNCILQTIDLEYKTQTMPLWIAPDKNKCNKCKK